MCGASYHFFGYQISQDSKIRFRLQVESYISDWLFSKSRLLASYVSRHKAMAYDIAPTNEAVRHDNQAEKTFVRKKINRHDQEVMEDVRTVLSSNTRKVL